MQKILDRMSHQLAQRQRQSSLRKLPRNLPAADFTSNDYLGLARNEVLAKNIQEAQKKYSDGIHAGHLHAGHLHAGHLHGATGSRLISGNLPLAEALELELAAWLQADSCLLFNSGYAANQGLLSAILQRGDTVIYDELAHACIKDGCRLSAASRFSFRHNDLTQLQQKISRASGQVVVVVESVYSMDGDEAPLAALVDLCKSTGAALVVDEAHSTALWGPDGAGSCVATGLASEVLARVHTFGKALGVHGACVAGSQVLIHYLQNYARPFIYTTALPAHSLLAIQEALRYRQQHPVLVEQLFRNIGLFHHLLTIQANQVQARFIPARGPIQALLMPGNDKVRAAAEKLQAAGFGVWPIIAPTVPAGEERLRICIHSFNTEHEIGGLATALHQITS